MLRTHYAETVSFEKDSVIIQRGVPDEGSAYLIKSGRVSVFDGANNETRGPREFIGQRSALLGNTPRTTTATALEDCSLIEIPRHFIKECLAQSHPLIQTWVHSFSQGGYHMTAPGYAATEEAIDEILLANDFREAVVSNKAIGFHYQPVMDLKSGGIVGFEALMRWTKQDGTQISPGKFIPIIERTPLIREISQLAVHQACSAVTRLHQQTNNKFHIAVNFTADDFLGQDFAQMILKAVVDSSCAPEEFVIEITERTVALKPEETARALHQCREKGLRTSLDDFGTGYSSLRHLHTLPIDTLKIDQAFVQGMVNNTTDLAIVQTIIGLADQIGAQTVAEGVETEKQLDMLKGAGCDMAQGYLIRKPGTEAEILDFIRNYPAPAVP